MVGCIWLPSLIEIIELATTLLMVTSHSHTHTDAHFFGVQDKSVHTNDNLLKNGIGCISRFRIKIKRKFIIFAACLPWNYDLSY